MAIGAYRRIFGAGPAGAGITVALFFMAWLVNQALGHPRILAHPFPLWIAGVILTIFGLALHMWSFFTLRNWWRNDQLCTTGPFQYFRHPMYAAWVTFISMGVALMLNSWVYILWAYALHPIWHVLVVREEKIMGQVFGDQYRQYADRTGRFFPRLS